MELKHNETFILEENRQEQLHRLHPAQGLSPDVGPPRGEPTSLPGPEGPVAGRHLFVREMVSYPRKDMGEGKRIHVPLI